MKRKMTYFLAMIMLFGGGMAVWTMAARAGYESAEYQVVEADGKCEIREYPDLMLVATSSEIDTQGRDGSFMRLFRYISGANESEQKIAMTTPVFMDGAVGNSSVSMGFVLPKDVAAKGVPKPSGEGVKIRKRSGGRFAVIRFAGRLNSRSAKQQEEVLRGWMKTRGLEGESQAEAAGYDPPFTPGPLRRNEVLIRLSDSGNEETRS